MDSPIEDSDTIQIGPQIPNNNNNSCNNNSISSSSSSSNNNNNNHTETYSTKLASKLNHFFALRESKGLSLNHQLASHPDFHAPGITESLLDVVGLDPWGSNLPDDISKPAWEAVEPVGAFDYQKVALNQRSQWEAKNPSFRK